MCQHNREVTHTRDTYTGTEDVAQTLTLHAHGLLAGNYRSMS